MDFFMTKRKPVAKKPVTKRKAPIKKGTTAKKNIEVNVGKKKAKTSLLKKKREIKKKGGVDEVLVQKPSVAMLNSIDKKKRYLSALSQVGTISKACEMAGMTPTLYYYWVDAKYCHGKYYDEAFVDQCAIAKAAWRDVVRDEINRRAIEGVLKPVFGSLGAGQGAGKIGEVREFSDRLMEVLAKMNLPEAKEPKEGGNTVLIDNRSVHQTTVNFDPASMTQLQRDAMRNFIDSMSEPEAIEHKS